MSNNLDELDFEIDCPTCNKSIQISNKDVGKSISCPYCNQTINLKDAGLNESIDNANQLINNLFDNLGK